MIDVKDATQNAFKYLRELHGDIQGVLLEEVELTEDEKFWLITLSFPDPELIYLEIFKTNPKRKYKIFMISVRNYLQKSQHLKRQLST